MRHVIASTCADYGALWSVKFHTTANMAVRRSIDWYASLLTVLLLFHLSKQDSGAARLPHCHTQHSSTVSAAGKLGISHSGQIGTLHAYHTTANNAPTAATAIEAVRGIRSADTAAGSAFISPAVPACSTINASTAAAGRHLLQQQVLLYRSQTAAPAATATGTAAPAARTLPAYRDGCTPRPAFRMFVPDFMQSTHSYLSIVLQLIQPSAALQLWQLLNTTACGPAYSCLLTVEPPAEVVADSLGISEAEGVGRISIKLPKVGSTVVASSVKLELTADPCSMYGTAANISVPIYSGAPRGALQTLTAPTLTNSTFTVEADFGRGISGFDLSHFMLNNISGISSIVRTNDSSFVLFCEGMAEKTGQLQLQDGSFISSTYVGGSATSVLEVQTPGLQEILPLYATAAHTILPIALGVSGFACAIAIFAIPGTPLASCAPTLIRTLGHLQILAASAGISRAVGNEGFSRSFAAAAGRLSWALFDWFPLTAVQALNKDWVQLLAVVPPTVDTTWTPAQPDGTQLDSWLADIQNSSALIRAYDVYSSVTQQIQLQQLGLATRAAAPQLPPIVNIPPNLQGLAFGAWNGLISCCQVSVCLLIGGVLVHMLISVLPGTSSWKGPMKSNRVIRIAPASVQFPLLVITALLLTLPSLLHWVGHLIAAKQQFWMVFAGVVSVGVIAGVLYVWVLHKVLTTAQTALLPASVLGAAAGQAVAATNSEVELLTLDGGKQQTRYSNVARQRQQQQQPGRISKDVSMLQQVNPGEAVTVVRHSGSHSGQRAYPQQHTAGYPIAEAASTLIPSDDEAAADAELNSSSRTGSATLLEAVASTLQEYQQRLQAFSRSKAYLSVSGRSWSSQQQEQAEGMIQAVNAGPLSTAEAMNVMNELPAERLAQLSSHTQQQHEQQGQINSLSELGCSGNSRPLAEAYELPNSTLDEDVERLQQEEVLREQREARKRAKVRKQLRQQRMRPDAVIQPRPLPLDPPELTALDQPVDRYVAAVSAAGSIQQAAVQGGVGNVYESWGVSALQQQQQQRQGASRITSKAGTKSGVPAATAAAATTLEPAGILTTCLASCGLLQGLGSQVHFGNTLVEQRLCYMARYGVLLWDVTGSVGTTDPQDEARLVIGARRAALLVANILFAMLAGVCCALYGSIGPAGVFEPQIWGITLVQIVWLVYVVGLNPFCEVLTTSIEVMVTSGQVLVALCALMGIVQGEAVMAKTRIVSLCCLASMVIFITIVECLRALMLAVSVWYGVRQGSRRKKRVAPLV